MAIKTSLVPLTSRVRETVDIKIVNNVSLDGIWDDWLFSAGQLDTTEALANAVKVALLTDARASNQDILPDPDDDNRRGWWGDYEAAEIWDGWPIGCKNWLLLRSKITDSWAAEGGTLIRAEQYCRQALQPLINNRICTHIEVKAERIDLQRIDVTIVVYRGPNREIALRFQDLWAEIREM